MNPFTDIFWDLSYSYRLILKHLLRLEKKYKGNVFVLQKSLAEWCRCSTRTVKRAIARFIKEGWIGTRLRKRRCSQFFLTKEIKQNLFEIDNPKKQSFHSENVPSMAPLYTTCPDIVDIDPTTTEKRIQNFRKREKDDLSEQDKKDLKQEFSERVFEEAKQTYNWSIREKKFKPNTMYGYLRHLCKKIYKKFNQ
jgi:DNA-binding MarR family transcriptional regulator